MARSVALCSTHRWGPCVAIKARKGPKRWVESDRGAEKPSQSEQLRPTTGTNQRLFLFGSWVVCLLLTLARLPKTTYQRSPNKQAIGYFLFVWVGALGSLWERFLALLFATTCTSKAPLTGLHKRLVVGACPGGRLGSLGWWENMRPRACVSYSPSLSAYLSISWFVRGACRRAFICC